MIDINEQDKVEKLPRIKLLILEELFRGALMARFNNWSEADFIDSAKATWLHVNGEGEDQ